MLSSHLRMMRPSQVAFRRIGFRRVSHAADQSPTKSTVTPGASTQTAQPLPSRPAKPPVALPASRSHPIPAAQAHGRLQQRESDTDVYVISILLFAAIPPVVYYYYQYRMRHMREKREAILKEIQERAARTG